jgi:acetyl-CoA synthetase
MKTRRRSNTSSSSAARGSLSDELDAPMVEGRDHWYHDLVAEASSECGALDGRRGHALHPLHLWDDREAEGGRAHHRWLPDPGPCHDEGRVRPARRRRLLVHRRRRLDHRPQLHRLRPPRERGAGSDVRGGARLAGPGPVLGDLRAVRGVDLLHRADRDRAFMRWGEQWPGKSDLSKLRLLGSVGEPINPEAWMWYHQRDRGRAVPDRRHVVADRDRRDHDHPAARRDRDEARHRDAAVPGHRRDHSGEKGHERPATWRSRHRGPRCSEPCGATTSASAPPTGRSGPTPTSPGDGAKRDEDGYYWILGRVDDVLNVAGHRIGTMEVESALVDHPAVAEPPSWARSTTSRARRSRRS